MVDILKAVRAWLIADATVASVTASRVFALELPKAEAENMPRAAVVLRLAGGLGSTGTNDYVDVTTIRIDVFNYGLDPIATVTVQRATHDALKSINRNLQSGVLLHSAGQSGGPIYFQDMDTSWPVTVESWSIFASELAAV